MKTLIISALLLVNCSLIAQYYPIFQRDVNDPQYNSYTWKDMEFATENTGLLIARYVDTYNGFSRSNLIAYHTHDGGQNWDSTVFEFCSLIDLEVLNDSVMYISAVRTTNGGVNNPGTVERYIYKTFDGGNSWDSVFIDSLLLGGGNHSLCFINDSTGLFTLNEGYVKTTDFGETWYFDTIPSQNSDWRRYPMKQGEEVLSFDYNKIYTLDPYTMNESSQNVLSNLCSGNISEAAINKQGNKFITKRLCADGYDLNYPTHNYFKIQYFDNGNESSFDLPYHNPIGAIDMVNSRIRLVLSFIYPAYSDDAGQSFYVQELIETPSLYETAINNTEFPSDSVGYLLTFNPDASKQLRIFKTINGGGPVVDSLQSVNNTLNTDTPSQQLALSIYPNPSTGIFALDYDLSSSSASIEVYDMFGKKVHTTTLTGTKGNHVLDLSHVSKGVYFLKVEGDNTTKSYKIVKQ